LEDEEIIGKSEGRKSGDFEDTKWLSEGRK
jgi:hypothetical protein